MIQPTGFLLNLATSSFAIVVSAWLGRETTDKTDLANTLTESIAAMRVHPRSYNPVVSEMAVYHQLSLYTISL